MNNILLCGNPNVGKSSIYNILTSSHEHTGNWTGVTVEECKAKIKGTNYYLIDLPGTYSLSGLSDEELITRDALLYSNYEKIIYVMDASNIEKNMNLLLEILEINPNVILCINMIDEIYNKGINIDINMLSDILGIDIVCTSTVDNKGFDELIELLDNSRLSNYRYLYSYYVESCMKELSSISSIDNRFILHSILSKDKCTSKYINKKIVNYLLTIDSSKVIDDIYIKINSLSSEICSRVVKRTKSKRISFLDKLSTNKIISVIFMTLVLLTIFFITIVLANYPSELLSKMFNKIELLIYNCCIKYNVNKYIYEPLLFGIFRVVGFIISVMFPPLVIFFFLFTYAEESGILPRIAFNLDKVCNKCSCHGKQVLTMCSGFGCNACAVVGSRIIDNKRDRLLAIITNSFIPCNGRFPMILTLISIFFSDNKLIAALYLTIFIILSIVISFIVTYILSKTILKGYSGFFILELPDYKKVSIKKIIKTSFVYKSLSILKKTILVAIPSGIIIWIVNNITINNLSLYNYIINMLNPISRLLGLDGVTLSAFILGLPANEIVLPLIMMGYMNIKNLMDISNIETIRNVLIMNSWSIKTALSVIIFSIMHFPCGTTLLTIKNEVGFKWMIVSFIVPLLTGIVFLIVLNVIMI